MGERRHFGYVRKRGSGRWQATYRHEGRLHSVGTFEYKADALSALAEVETEIRRGKWIDPRLGDQTLEKYAREWIANRHDLAIRTLETYNYLLDRHVLPTLGQRRLGSISPAQVRTWNAESARKHASTAAKAYRLLSTIMRTAVVDELISSSPCRVKGASQEQAPERPTATLDEVNAISEQMPDHLRIAIDLALWCQLRKAEVLGLQRRDIELGERLIRIERSRTFLTTGREVLKEPKTAAGRRDLVIPAHVAAKLEDHLRRFVPSKTDAFVMCTSTGIPISQVALQRGWHKARHAVGRDDLHFHDLRHTGLTFAAATGATTAELMHRAGHVSPVAASRYQHSSRDRDRVLADRLDQLQIDMS